MHRPPGRPAATAGEAEEIRDHGRVTMIRIGRSSSRGGNRRRQRATRSTAVLLATGVAAGGLLLATPVANASPRAGVVAATGSTTSCQRTLSNYPTVWPGDRGPVVSTLQCVLNDAGLGPVVVDGWYNPQTSAAVLNSQGHGGSG